MPLEKSKHQGANVVMNWFIDKKYPSPSTAHQQNPYQASGAHYPTTTSTKNPLSLK